MLFLVFFGVFQVKYSYDHRSVTVNLKESAPGGARAVKVGLPYDPDLLDHLVIPQIPLRV